MKLTFICFIICGMSISYLWYLVTVNLTEMEDVFTIVMYQTQAEKKSLSPNTITVHINLHCNILF